jgi:hypothetical protein
MYIFTIITVVEASLGVRSVSVTLILKIIKIIILKAVILRCPYCGQVLEKIKERKDFFVFKCKNEKCSFYLDNLKSLSRKDRERFEKNPHEFKLHYTFISLILILCRSVRKAVSDEGGPFETSCEFV